MGGFYVLLRQIVKLSWNLRPPLSLFDGLVERLREQPIDIACLPVNGREAAELAVAVSAEVLIPMHNNMFAANHVTPAILADFLDRTYPRQRCHWLQPGELYYYVRE